MYGKGEGVEWNFKEAMKWYRKAADQGYAEAQHGLGHKYYTGEGVPRDYGTAYAWYNIAVANGFADAEKYKGIVVKKMPPAQLAKAEELVKEMIAKNPKLIK